MKVAIITDSHFGVRKDSRIFYKHQQLFFDNVFFPYIDKHKIDTVIHLGDSFDRRVSTNSLTLKMAKQMFFDELKKRKIAVHMIVGNHDNFYNEDNSINTPDLLLKEYDFNHYTDPEIIELDGTKILLLPWITKHNIDDTNSLIKKQEAMIVMGHLEINGFEMSGSKVCEKGLSRKLFSDYPMVLSGHFHKKSKDGNIQYLGNPYETDWADCGMEKGFHVLDTKKISLSFIKNHYNVFLKINYDEANTPVLEKSDVENKYVKMIIKNRTDHSKYEEIESAIKKMNPFNFTVDDRELLKIDEEIEFDISIENTSKIISDYIENTEEILVDKTNLTDFMLELYADASNI